MCVCVCVCGVRVCTYVCACIDVHTSFQDQYEWFESSAKTRADQISDLLDRLSEFNKHYDVLRQFVKEGNELLEEQKSLGASAATMKERMEVAQVSEIEFYRKLPIISPPPPLQLEGTGIGRLCNNGTSYISPPCCSELMYGDRPWALHVRRRL